MKIAHETDLISPGTTHPTIAIGGDDDVESPDLRLSFTTSHGMCFHDMPPNRLAALGAMIFESLADNGFCRHGVADTDYCRDCCVDPSTDPLGE